MCPGFDDSGSGRCGRGRGRAPAARGGQGETAGPLQQVRAEIKEGESMRWRPVAMTAAAVLGTALLTGAGAATGSLAPADAGTAVSAAAQSGTWGMAAEIPGSN